MPTHEEYAQFLRAWSKLTQQQKRLFLAARDDMVEDLRAHQPFRPSLRIKVVQGRRGIFEMTWAPEGHLTSVPRTAPLIDQLIFGLGIACLGGAFLSGALFALVDTTKRKNQRRYLAKEQAKRDEKDV